MNHVNIRFIPNSIRRAQNAYFRHTLIRPFNQGDWLLLGIKKGWCSPPACSTHDLIPMSAEEEAEWEEGNDPCQYVVRVDEWE